ncbi:hypothetical protein G7043_31365 [Lentzea sp. NEAU-D13]|uniref:Uncharacterized protein n=1 Tax=Lentzea alba TaxID=2714351 RepID=A0A7C9VUQ0_9PSEU|nr:hypothetical protein [Lentzea alba]NGY63432.1 hypothetical protein [Lentzea alba]
MALSPAERALRARLAAHTRWSRTSNSTESTAAARAAFDRRFEDEVDPRRELPEPERVRRAEAARRAHFARLTLKSVTARRKAREAQEAVSRTEAALQAGFEIDGGAA